MFQKKVCAIRNNSSFIQPNFQIRSDTALCLGTTLPEVHKKAQQMKLIFERIDKLTVSNTCDHDDYVT